MNTFLRGSFNIVSHGASSASNLLLQLGLLSTLNDETFGVFVLVLSSYFFAVVLARSSTLEVLVVLGQTDEMPTLRWVVYRLVLLGVIAAGCALGFGFLADGYFLSVIPIAVAIPFLMFQDGLRHYMWTAGLNLQVAIVDSVWLIGTLAPIAAFYWTDSLSAIAATSAWSISGVASLAVALFVGRSAIPKLADPDPKQNSVAHRKGLSMLGDQAPLAVMSHLFPIVLAAVAGAAVVGNYRTVFLPFMAAETLLAAVRILIIPHLNPQRAQRSGATSMWHLTGIYSGISAVLVVCTIVALKLPVKSLFNDPFGKVGALVFVVAVIIFVRTSIRVPSDFSILRMNASRVLRFRSAWTAVEFVSALVGALLTGGLVGAIVARCGVGILTAIAWVIKARGFTQAGQRPVD